MLDSECMLSDEHLTIWLKVMRRSTMTEHAFRVLVVSNVSFELLIRELASYYFVQLTDSDDLWNIDCIMLAAYAEVKRGDGFVKKFLKYICTNKEYMVYRVRDDLLRRFWSKRYLKFLH
tara:strand:- start:3747 stop:4103 length:357 start_codon:yes stop_codon:yes gene_type:complete